MSKQNAYRCNLRSRTVGEFQVVVQQKIQDTSKKTTASILNILLIRLTNSKSNFIKEYRRQSSHLLIINSNSR